MILSVGLLCVHSSIPRPHFPHRQAPNILAGERINCRPFPGTSQYVVLHVWPSHIESPLETPDFGPSHISSPASTNQQVISCAVNTIPSHHELHDGDTDGTLQPQA